MLNQLKDIYSLPSYFAVINGDLYRRTQESMINMNELDEYLGHINQYVIIERFVVNVPPNTPAYNIIHINEVRGISFEAIKSSNLISGLGALDNLFLRYINVLNNILFVNNYDMRI